MSGYTQAIDLHITQMLQLRGYVTTSMLAGLEQADAIEMLRHYASVHSAHMPIGFDGKELSMNVEPPVQDAAKPDGVFVVESGTSLLDSGPAAPFSRWLWLLPMTFGLIGGVIGWFLLKETNRGGARAMLMTGGGLQAVQMVFGFLVAGSLISGLGTAAQAATWPPSPYGNASLYYFGTST